MGLSKPSTNKDYYKLLCVNNVNRGGKKSKNDSRKSGKPENLQRLRDQIVEHVERKKEENNTYRPF